MCSSSILLESETLWVNRVHFKIIFLTTLFFRSGLILNFFLNWYTLYFLPGIESSFIDLRKITSPSYDLISIYLQLLYYPDVGWVHTFNLNWFQKYFMQTLESKNYWYFCYLFTNKLSRLFRILLKTFEINLIFLNVTPSIICKKDQNLNPVNEQMV